MTRRRWSCPNGEHPGVLAPGRLRKIDVRRYCLPCSEASGVLVERVCAANERRSKISKRKASQKQAAKRKEKARVRQAKKARQREREHAAGVEIAREYDRLWSYAARLRPSLPPTAPPLTVSRASHDDTSGHAMYGYSTHLTIGRRCTRSRVCGVIAHEIAHHMAGAREAHSDAFWSGLAELAEAAYPGTEIGVLRGPKWRKQGHIEHRMRIGCDFLRDDVPFEPPRKPPVSGQRRTKVRSVRE